MPATRPASATACLSWDTWSVSSTTNFKARSPEYRRMCINEIALTRSGLSVAAARESADANPATSPPSAKRSQVTCNGSTGLPP